MTNKQQFDAGDRVSTPLGNATVQSRRMAPPDFCSVEAYSVLLDHKVEATKYPPFPNYNGTVFSVDDIEALNDV